MPMYQIERKNLDALFSSLASAQDLILPVRSAGKTDFALWSDLSEVDLDATKTVRTGKDVFFPQSETLYTCVRDGKQLTVTPKELCERAFVVFGMRPCDAKGVEVLDQVFLSDPVDSFYEARRRNGTIVTLSCREPDETCFCRAYGIDCADPSSGSDKGEILPVTDVALWIIGETLYWQPLTEKGETLTECVRELLSETHAEDEEALKREQERVRGIVEKLPFMNLTLEGWGGSSTEEKFDSPLWESLSQACIGCGTCTFLCPTCQCYDIKDYDTGRGVQRYRCWDSCMYSEFTLMAAANSRTTQMQRFRQRFMHKLVYFPENNDGMYSCVGCGRCVTYCPESLNIVKVIRAFGVGGEEG